MLKEEANEGIPEELRDRIAVDSVIARKAGPHLHSVIKLKIDESIGVNELFDAKARIEEEMHHISNLQTVVIDVCGNHDHEHHHHCDHHH